MQQLSVRSQYSSGFPALNEHCSPRNRTQQDSVKQGSHRDGSLLWRAVRVGTCAFTSVVLLGLFAHVLAARLHSRSPVHVTRFVRILLEEHQRYHQLARKDEAVLLCVQGKSQVIDAIVAGKLSFEEAVDRFALLEQARDEAAVDGGDSSVGKVGKGKTSEQKRAMQVRQVQFWLRVKLRSGQQLPGAVKTRLKAHLDHSTTNPTT